MIAPSENVPQFETSIHWPDGRNFAFTVIDDTDCSTVENTRPVYDLLAEYGFRTTKTVWPLAASGRPVSGGHSLDHEGYRAWVLRLKSLGFEIALHGVADESSPRGRILEGLQRYREILKEDPSVHVNHLGQAEGIYWGAERFDQPVRALYRLYRGIRGAEVKAFGIQADSPYFWGDICSRIPRFVRNMVFFDINTLKMDPLMPYHDPRRPFVQRWFSASHGSGVNAFCNLISEQNLDRLEREGGCCIVYTHLGSSFYPVPSELKRLLRKLAARNGWFVPVTPLLNHIGAQRNWPDTSRYRRAYLGMQWRWFMQQIGRRSPGRISDILSGGERGSLPDLRTDEWSVPRS